jgi:gluconate 2-dehydrogenase gamma chain
MTDSFFDSHQHATIEAAMARIIPTDDQPGARETGTIYFLERYLSGIGYVYAKPDGSGFEQLDGPRADAWRQRIDAARAKYEAGIIELDRLANHRYGGDFVALTEEQQDEVLRAVELADSGVDHQQITYGGPVQPPLQQTSSEAELGFFGLLVAHTRQGFYADPIYGGNRGQAGWRVIGFPGPASLAEVYTGRYSTLDYFADERTHRTQEAGQ